MCGTDKSGGINPSDQEKRLISVLDRQGTVDSLGALIYALRSEPSKNALSGTAIALDASVFLRLPNNDDVVDYLGSAHLAPLILPGQAVQEFWNNQLHVVDTIGAKLQKEVDRFKGELIKMDPSFGDYGAKFTELADQFGAEHGYLFDEGTVRRTLAVLEMLQKRALVPYARRCLFGEMALQRKRTRTPPGFRDEGDVDFFIWVDFLTGLQRAQAAKYEFGRAVLVSNDQKVDWVRSGKAHPILVAEVRALVNVPFEIWTLPRLAEEVANLS